MGASASAMPKPIEAIFHGEPLLAAGGADAFDTYFSKDAKVEFLGQWAPKTADGKAVIITSKELKEVFDCLIKGFSDFTVRRRRGRGFDAIIRSTSSIIHPIGRRVSTFWCSRFFSLFSLSSPYCLYIHMYERENAHPFFLRFETDERRLVCPAPSFEQFNKKKAQFVFDEQEKCWKATIIVTGTHDGPYTFAPGEIDALEPTKKKCVVGPEIFRIFIDEKTEKIKKFTVEPLADKPSGPPGFYVLAGGKLPQPTTAA